MGLQANLAYKRKLYAVILDNVWYSMASEAQRSLYIPLSTISYRCQYPNFPNYRSLKNIGKKKKKYQIFLSEKT